MSGKKKEPLDPERLSPEEKLKYEIAEELGLAGQVAKQGWRSLTSKESGRIGGILARRKKQLGL